jgi:uncharacterized hydrophobic protein (TIGR00271 family)
MSKDNSTNNHADNSKEEDPTKIKINPDIGENIKGIWSFLKETISFKEGADIESTIRNIRDGIDFKGPNVWVLICSIVVASVGLNTNSTAVIIGAMLISPLMGPIRGIGLGVGTNDIALIIDSLKNFGIAVGISLLTAWIYFLISPISELTPELEARTGPNLMDVFIAFFGGLAGIIAASRGDNSTVIPGVAIATALMPPLCTAGYGLAIGNFQFFFGASYLFLLNTLFICLSTIVVVRYLKFPVRHFIDPKVEKKVTWTSYILLFLVVIPSVFLFYAKVQETVFRENAKRFVNQVVLSDETVRADFMYEYDGDSSSIEVFLRNKVVSDDVIKLWKRQLNTYGLNPSYLHIIQGEDVEEKIASLKKDLEETTTLGGFDLIKEKQNTIDNLKDELKKLKKEMQSKDLGALNIISLKESIELHFPEVDTFEVYTGIRPNVNNELDSTFALGVKFFPDQIKEGNLDEINFRLMKQFEIFLKDRGLLKSHQVRIYNF